MAGLPAYDYQALSAALLANIAAGGGAPVPGAAHADAPARYS